MRRWLIRGGEAVKNRDKSLRKLEDCQLEEELWLKVVENRLNVESSTCCSCDLSRREGRDD